MRPASSRLRGCQWLVTAVALAVLSGLPAVAQTPRDVDVKATYLLNFCRFVRWPAAALPPAAPITICVIGSDPFGAILDKTLSGETVDGHRVVARRVARLEDAPGCHMLFVARDLQPEWSRWLQAVETTPLLTVSDMPRFSESGGMIQLVSTNNRIRFELNLAAAARARLTFSSELSRLALTVRREGETR